MEITTLLGHLDGQRRHVLGILDGLDDEALRRPVLPSGWSCLGMVRHLAWDVEKWWFRAIMAGEQTAIDEAVMVGDDAWKVGPEVSSESIFELYRRETELANGIATSGWLDAAPIWWPDDWPAEDRPADVGEVIMHVIVETACHAGHLDAVRELIDGRQWMLMTG